MSKEIKFIKETEVNKIIVKVGKKMRFTNDIADAFVSSNNAVLVNELSKAKEKK